jgi:hypothetical protein
VGAVEAAQAEVRADRVAVRALPGRGEGAYTARPVRREPCDEAQGQTVGPRQKPEVLDVGEFGTLVRRQEAHRGTTVHGEPSAAQSLQSAIRDNFKWNVSVARYLDTIDLASKL